MRFQDSLEPLRHGQFRLYLGARFASLLGNAVAPIALAFAVLDLTASVSALGLVLAARSIPQVVLMLFGGVVADRFPRHRVLVVSNGLCFATQALAAALLLSGSAQVWQLVVIEAVNGAAAAFTFPAMIGLLPQLVPRHQLQQANALSGMARNVALIGGASAGGAVVAFIGSGWGLAFDAVSFGLAALLLSRLRVSHTERLQASSVWFDLREGWTEFVSRRWVWVIVVAFGALNAIQVGIMMALGPKIADSTIGRSGWGYVLAAQALGFVVGTLLMLRYRPRYPMRAGMLGICAYVPLLLILGLQPQVVPLVLLAVLSGIGVDVFGISWETSLQQHVPQEKLSRVFSYDALGSFVAIPVGQLVAGPLAGAFGVSTVVTAGAVLYGLIALATLADPSVRRLERSDQAFDHGSGRESDESQPGAAPAEARDAAATAT